MASYRCSACSTQEFARHLTLFRSRLYMASCSGFLRRRSCALGPCFLGCGTPPRNCVQADAYRSGAQLICYRLRCWYGAGLADILWLVWRPCRVRMRDKREYAIFAFAFTLTWSFAPRPPPIQPLDLGPARHLDDAVSPFSSALLPLPNNSVQTSELYTCDFLGFRRATLTIRLSVFRSCVRGPGRPFPEARPGRCLQRSPPV